MKTTFFNDIVLAIYEILKEKQGEELVQSFKKIVSFLKNRELLEETEKILFKLEEIINQKEKRTVARLFSAKPIPGREKSLLAGVLNKRYSTETVEFKEIIDEKLLGGFRIEVGDEIIDNTVKGKLKKLQASLIN